MPPPYLENGRLWYPRVSSGVSSPGASGASLPGSLGPGGFGGGRPGWPRGGRGRRRSPTRRSPHYTIFLTDCKEAELRDDGQKGTILVYFCGVCLLNYFFFSFFKVDCPFWKKSKICLPFSSIINYYFTLSSRCKNSESVRPASFFGLLPAPFFSFFVGQLGKEKEKKEQLGQKSDVEGGRGRRFTPKRKRRRTLKEKQV